MVQNSTDRPRVVAFYLPQFHPIGENDKWWEPGFTEWTNVTKAKPLYRGHKQPILPSELGFYDLRVPEVRQAQSDLAQAYGVEAFLYWHYWFGDGSRLLERPFQEVLSLGQPGISFCLAWANESWTGAWMGLSEQVMREQTYPGVDDYERHFDALLPAFRDARYLRVDGRPVFYVYRPRGIPNIAEFIDVWQSRARRSGLDGLYLVAEISDGLGDGPPNMWTETAGFDAVAYLRLPVDLSALSLLRRGKVRRAMGLPGIYRYDPHRLSQLVGYERVQPVVYPNWDNTPRMGSSGLALVGTDPSQFELAVREARLVIKDRPGSEQFIWVKSWNEWAEGNHLEPDRHYGRGWLEALSRAIS